MERKVCTIGEWLDVWYEVYAVPEYASKTLEIYRDARKRLSRRFPEIESTLLTELLPVTFQKALNDLSKKYAKSSLRHIKSLYNLAYQTAIENHQCTENPINGVTVPKKASEKVINGLSHEEQQAFEEAAKQLTIRDQFILQTFLLTGLRRGELQNLRWQDWDKKAKVLRVEKSKTKNGIRSVTVIPEVALMLTHLQGWAKRCSSNRYIFGDAEPVSAGHLRHICLYTSKCAGIRRVSPHMLRHTFATRMIENGSDAKSLALIIGHSNPAFTLRRYVHPDHTSLYEQMCRLSSIQQ